MEKCQEKISKIALGLTDIKCSRIGLGCMGMSAFYKSHEYLNEDDMVNLIGEALIQGVNFFDTAQIYGQGANQRLLGKVIKLVQWLQKNMEEKNLQLQLKLQPILQTIKEIMELRMVLFSNLGKKQAINEACEKALSILEVDFIDIFYMHKMDVDTPIEETVDAFKYLISIGKIKAYGLSEAGPNTIRRAHAVHPCAVNLINQVCLRRMVFINLRFRKQRCFGCLQRIRNFYSSLFSIGKVKINYHKRILTGKIQSKTDLPKDDWRSHIPRFQEDAIEQNKKQLQFVEQMAQQKQFTPSQISLAWVLAKGNILIFQGEDIFIIPGTTKLRYLTENNNSLSVKLSLSDINDLNNVFLIKSIQGDRYTVQHMGRLCKEAI